VARPARLKTWLWLGVLLAHVVALEWVGDHLAPMTSLRKMADPMFTRMLQPQAPAPVVVAAQPAPPPRPVARNVKAPAPKRAASAPPPPESAASASAETKVAQAAPDAPTTPASAAASAPAPVASAAAIPELSSALAIGPAAPTAAPSASAASAPANLDSWPVDTRLSYRLGGRFRSGDLYGDARVQWQRDGAAYQVRVDIDIKVWVHLVMTSQGEVTAQGLRPRGYEELRRGKRRAVQLGPETVLLDNGRTAARPDGVQDTASQFVELSHRFATGQEKLEVGRTVTFWMARPGAVDQWTYDIVEREVLQTPTLGPVEAYRLKPRPIANPRGNITAEMWFAPSLQYLPVRIRVTMGDEAQVDLLVDRIEQR
jgi:hypothetical protein